MLTQIPLRFRSAIVATTICGIFYLAAFNTVYSQETLTPTPAPSKTAESSVDSTPEATEESAQSHLNQPFTQSDLSILTGNVQRPNGVVWFDDNLYVICNGDWTIYKLDSRDGTTETYIYGVRNAHAIVVEQLADDSFNLWVPDFDTGSLLRINQNRAPQSVVSNLTSPWGIAYLDSERFVVSNLTGDNAVVINKEGSIQATIGDLRSPTGVASDDRYIYIANNGSSRRSIEWISKVDILAGEETGLSPLVYGLQNTTGLATGPDGFLYFAFALGTRGVVGRVDPEVCREQERGCSNEQVEIVLYTELAAPLAGLAISPDYRLFIHTIYRPEIYWVQLREQIE